MDSPKVRIFKSVIKENGQVRETLYVTFQFGDEIASWNSQSREVRVRQTAKDNPAQHEAYN